MRHAVLVVSGALSSVGTITIERGALSPNKQLQRTVMRRRARGARPLNCGVMRYVSDLDRT
jgi:hypothetical protein